MLQLVDCHTLLEVCHAIALFCLAPAACQSLPPPWLPQPIVAAAARTSRHLKVGPAISRRLPGHYRTRLAAAAYHTHTRLPTHKPGCSRHTNLVVPIALAPHARYLSPTPAYTRPLPPLIWHTPAYNRLLPLLMSGCRCHTWLSPPGHGPSPQQKCHARMSRPCPLHGPS